MVESNVQVDRTMYQDIYQEFAVSINDTHANSDNSALAQFKKQIIESQHLIVEVIQNDHVVKQLSQLLLQSGYDNLELNNDEKVQKFAKLTQDVTEIKDYLMNLFRDIVVFHKQLVQFVETKHGGEQANTISNTLKEYRNRLKSQILASIQTYEDELQFYCVKYTIDTQDDDEYFNYICNILRFFKQLIESQTKGFNSLQENVWKTSMEYLQMYQFGQDSYNDQNQISLRRAKLNAEKERNQSQQMLQWLNSMCNQVDKIKQIYKRIKQIERRYKDSVNYLGVLRKTQPENSVLKNEAAAGKQAFVKIALQQIQNNVILQINSLYIQINDYFTQQCPLKDLDVPVLQYTQQTTGDQIQTQLGCNNQALQQDHLNELITCIQTSFDGQQPVDSIQQIVKKKPIFNIDSFDIEADKPAYVTKTNQLVAFAGKPTIGMILQWIDHQILVLIAVVNNALFFSLEQHTGAKETLLFDDMFELLCGCFDGVAVYIGQHKNGKYEFIKHDGLFIKTGPSLTKGGLNISVSDLSFINDTITQFCTQLRVTTQRDVRSLTMKMAGISLHENGNPDMNTLILPEELKESGLPEQEV